MAIISKRIVLAFAVIHLIGCSRGVDSDGWTVHSLTEPEQVRQDELLAEIRWDISAQDLLAGRPASEFRELLGLADKTQNDETSTHYAFNVLAGGGGENEWCHAVIVVENGNIIRALWPYGEF